MKINDFQGDLSGISAKMATLMYAQATVCDCSHANVACAGENDDNDDDSDDYDDGYTMDYGGTQLLTKIDVVCLDMDGTLLNSASQVSKITSDIIKTNLGREGKTIMLATGKCRPAAIAACKAAKLAGVPPTSASF